MTGSLWLQVPVGGSISISTSMSTHLCMYIYIPIYKMPIECHLSIFFYLKTVETSWFNSVATYILSSGYSFNSGIFVSMGVILLVFSDPVPWPPLVNINIKHIWGLIHKEKLLMLLLIIVNTYLVFTSYAMLNETLFYQKYQISFFLFPIKYLMLRTEFFWT